MLLVEELAARGWPAAEAPGTAPGEVALTDRPDPGWVAAWAACEERRRGIAGHVVQALTRWAVERGARRLYLQVESAKGPAHAFYERAGFTRSHGYHYRAAPG